MRLFVDHDVCVAACQDGDGQRNLVLQNRLVLLQVTFLRLVLIIQDALSLFDVIDDEVEREHQNLLRHRKVESRIVVFDDEYERQAIDNPIVADRAVDKERQGKIRRYFPLLKLRARINQTGIKAQLACQLEVPVRLLWPRPHPGAPGQCPPPHPPTHTLGVCAHVRGCTAINACVGACMRGSMRADGGAGPLAGLFEEQSGLASEFSEGMGGGGSCGRVEGFEYW